MSMRSSSRSLRIAVAALSLWIGSVPASSAALNSAGLLQSAAAISAQLLPGFAAPTPAVAAAPAPANVSAVVGKAPKPGKPLPNFTQVSQGLYRSGQPTPEGVAKLRALGVKTILKLNADEPAESDWAASDGLDFETVLMSNRESPTYDQIDAALAIIDDKSKQPVLVHCHHGRDRTGAVVAAYRVTVQGMSVDQAVSEALSFGYGAPGFQDLKTYLTGYLDRRASK